MSSTLRVFAHLGLPKTASTFLQYRVFPAFRSVTYIKKHAYFRGPTPAQLARSTTLLFSNECESESRYRFELFRDRYPQAVVLLMLRRHDRWLGSKYKYYLRKGGGLTFDEYFRRDGSEGVLKPDELLFRKRIALAEEVFNRRPLVYFHEELVKNPAATIGSLAAAVGATVDQSAIQFGRVNEAFSDRQLHAIRALNQWARWRDVSEAPWLARLTRRRPKLRGLLVLLVAQLSSLVPGRSVSDEDIVPAAALDQIRDEFTPDWEDCVAYAAADRKVLL
jgi:hypothetical protein